MPRYLVGLCVGSATLAAGENARIRDAVGQGYDISTANLWDLSNMYPAPLFGEQTPDSCFVEQPCAHGSSYHFENLHSTSEWQQAFASGFGITLAGGYDGFKASISASYTDSFSEKALSDRASFHYKVWNRRKCNEIRPECVYNRSFLHPDFVSVMQKMPMQHDEASMQQWESQVIGRFGTHVNVASQHGAQIQVLTSADTSCHTASTCLKELACVKFEFLSYGDVDLCGNRSACKDDKGCNTLFESSCAVAGGDPKAASNNLCGPNVSQQDVSNFLASGDMSSPASAFGFTFKPVADVLSLMGIAKEAAIMEKAVEYHSCKQPTRAWKQNEDGEYSCTCDLKCNNGGQLDEKSCTCKCLGDQWHGWHGATCDSTYGQCQAGLETGNSADARKCSVDGKCQSSFWGDKCSETEVCCLTHYHGTCCPFGSTCSCTSMSCGCLVPPEGCGKPDTFEDHGEKPSASCASWWHDCSETGACKDLKKCAPGTFGDRECAGTCCMAKAGRNITGNFAAQALVV